MITQAVIIYLCIGGAFATLMMLGAARMEVGLELLHRPISPVFPIACTLIGAALAWPLVVWLLVRGRKADKVTMADVQASAQKTHADIIEGQIRRERANSAAFANANAPARVDPQDVSATMVEPLRAKGRDVL